MGNVHPIVIANPKPFRLILRDESDKWQCTTDQINSSNYNYVKLHRATRFIDVDLIEPFTLCLGYDGSLILPYLKEYADTNTALDEFNRIIAACFIGGLYIEAVSPNDLSLGHIANCGYYRHEYCFGDNAELHRAIGEKGAGSLYNIKLYSPPQILADDFESAYNVGSRILSLIPTLSPALLTTAFTYFLTSQFRESMTHAWISVEQIIENIWCEKVIEQTKDSSIPKRKKFLESQQWGFAHRIELLFTLNIIDEELYRDLNVARFERNAFQHTGKTPSREGVKSSLMAISKLLALVSTGYDCQLITRYLANENGRSNMPTIAMAKVDNLKETTVSHWRSPVRIPGFSKWETEFETYDDIQLKEL